MITILGLLVLVGGFFLLRNNGNVAQERNEDPGASTEVGGLDPADGVLTPTDYDMDGKG